MSFILFIQAIFLGIIEGLTEFLPISSTGHLIIAGKLIQFTDKIANSFNVIIQLGAILAVCWEYRSKIGAITISLPVNKQSRHFMYKLTLSFLPAALIGFFFIHAIKFYLFNISSVAWALMIGGLVILWIETKPRIAHITSIDQITLWDAFKIGLAQCFALIPGASRSGATIMGAMLFGIERKVATEFSFFLAIPVMFAATFYDVYMNWAMFSVSDLPIFATGFIMAFFSALIAIRVLLRFIATHTFIVFAWYRIFIGAVILLLI